MKNLEINKAYNDGWEQILINCPNEHIDLVYTDPPYGMNYCSNIAGDIRWNKLGKSENKFDKPMKGDKDGINFQLFAHQMYRVLKPDSWLVIHHNQDMMMRGFQYLLGAGFKHQDTVVWNKRSANGGDCTGGAMTRDWEPLTFFAKGKPKYNSIWVEREWKKRQKKKISFMITKKYYRRYEQGTELVGTVFFPDGIETLWSFSSDNILRVAHTEKTNTDYIDIFIELMEEKPFENLKINETEILLQFNERIMQAKDFNFGPVPKHEKRKFKTQKPIAVCKRVIQLTSNKGHLVLDPFMGSGTIPRTANQLGRNYITIELDENTYKDFGSTL